MIRELMKQISPAFKRSSFHMTLGTVLIAMVALLALLAPYVSPHDPHDVVTRRMMLPPAWVEGGSSEHILGTDNLGRDLLSRILHGTRITLLVGLGAVGFAAAIGITLGLLAGYYRGLLGDLIMRLADVQYSFPFIVLAIVIIATFGASLTTVTITLGVWGWALFARVTRAETLAVSQQDHIVACMALGASDLRILLRHILPNVAPPLIVIGSTAVAQIVIAESALSFLGLGVPPATPSLGTIVGDGRTYFAIAYWIITFPGLMIALIVLGINFFGDGLRDVLDPHLQER